MLRKKETSRSTHITRKKKLPFQRGKQEKSELSEINTVILMKKRVGFYEGGAPGRVAKSVRTSLGKSFLPSETMGEKCLERRKFGGDKIVRLQTWEKEKSLELKIQTRENHRVVSKGGKKDTCHPWERIGTSKGEKPVLTK